MCPTDIRALLAHFDLFFDRLPAVCPSSTNICPDTILTLAVARQDLYTSRVQRTCFRKKYNKEYHCKHVQMVDECICNKSNEKHKTETTLPVIKRYVRAPPASHHTDAANDGAKQAQRYH